MKKRILAILLAVLSIIGVFVNAPTASAATSPALVTKIRSLLPIITYAMPSSGAKQVYAYTYQDGSLGSKETSYYVNSFAEEIVVTAISDNGEAVNVRYLSGKGATRDKWFRTDDIFGLGGVSIADFQTNAAMTVYRMSSGSSVTKYGSVSKGSDVCYQLGSHNVGGTAYNTVIYKLSSASTVNGITAKHKMGLVTQSAYNSSTQIVSNGLFPGPVPEGVYTIVSCLDQNKVVDISGMSTDNCVQAQLWERNGCAAQDYQLIQHPDGWYLIVNIHSWKALDVANGVAARGQRVWQYEINYSAAQRWYLEDAGDGCFYIRSALGYYLDVSGACTTNGTPLNIWDGSKGNNAQKFRLEAKFAPVWPCEKSTYISTMYRYWNKGNPSSHKVRTNIYNAFDVSGCSGENIYAVEKGTVVEKGCQKDKNGEISGFGYYVVIAHNNGLYSLYGHLKEEARVNVGDPVNQKQVIGYMGNTGNSSGPHLHFEMYNPHDRNSVINPWVTYYQGKISVTVGGNSYNANSKYPSDTTATAWCNWLKNNCTKNSAGDYVFKK